VQPSYTQVWRAYDVFNVVAHDGSARTTFNGRLPADTGSVLRMLVRFSVALSIVLACSSSSNGRIDAGRGGDDAAANDQRVDEADASDVRADVDDAADALDGSACFAPGRDTREVDFLFWWEDSTAAHSAELGGIAQRTITASSDTLNIYVLAIAHITVSADALHDGTYTCGGSDGGRDSANVTFNNGANTPYEVCTITLSFTADDDGCPRVSGTFSAGHGVDGGAAMNGRFDVPLH
jgi:hypothetical protein